MGSREPSSWAPLSQHDLMALRERYRGYKLKELLTLYREMHGMCVLPEEIAIPAKPWVMQTMMQVYRELYRRYPKGR